MRSILILSLLSCFFAAYEAKIFSKCELAHVLKAAGMDGYYGYSLEDCEYKLLVHPFCLCPKRSSSLAKQSHPLHLSFTPLLRLSPTPLTALPVSAPSAL